MAIEFFSDELLFVGVGCMRGIVPICDRNRNNGL